jgi:hypothetical protein
VPISDELGSLRGVVTYEKLPSGSIAEATRWLPTSCTVRQRAGRLLHSMSGCPHVDHLVQVILQLVAQALSTQFAQRPGLDLSNAFPRQLECLTDFL